MVMVTLLKTSSASTCGHGDICEGSAVALVRKNEQMFTLWSFLVWLEFVSGNATDNNHDMFLNKYIKVTLL